MNTTLDWIDDYIKYLSLIPVLLIFGDWIYGRIILHFIRKNLEACIKERDSYKERYEEVVVKFERVNQTVVRHGITFLANDFRSCSIPTEVMPICPSCFPDRRIYLHAGQGVGLFLKRFAQGKSHDA